MEINAKFWGCSYLKWLLWISVVIHYVIVGLSGGMCCAEGFLVREPAVRAVRLYFTVRLGSAYCKAGQKTCKKLELIMLRLMKYNGKLRVDMGSCTSK